MKESHIEKGLSNPNRGLAQSPALSILSSENPQFPKITILSSLNSKRNSQIDPIISDLNRKQQSKSLIRSSRASSILNSTNSQNNKSPVSLKLTEKIPGNSRDSPDWFKISVPICRQNNEDGKISVLSKLNGWIHVSEESKSRKNRAGKLGPFDSKDFNVHKVSGLAPSWMHRERLNGSEMRKKNYSPAFSCMNKEEKRLFLFEGSQLDISYPKYLENSEKVKKSVATGYKPIILYEWKEPEGSELKVTGKIGRQN